MRRHAEIKGKIAQVEEKKKRCGGVERGSKTMIPYYASHMEAIEEW